MQSSARSELAHIVYTDMAGQERTVNIGASAPVVSIGRAVDCTIRSNRKSVSRHHAEFRYSNGQFEVIDLNSSNGTYLIINEQRRPVMGREYVTHNDEVWCGDFILRFFEQDELGFDATGNALADAPAAMVTFGGNAPKPIIGDNAAAPLGQTVPPETPIEKPAGWAQSDGGAQSSWIEEPRQAKPLEAPRVGPPELKSQGSNPAQSHLRDLQSAESASENVPAGVQRPTWAHELAAESNTNWEPAPAEPAAANQTNDGELDRILAEKRSIEDMASRQQQEIERLEALLDDMRHADGPSAPPNTKTLSQLEAQLSESQDEVARLEEALNNQSNVGVRTDELEREIDELRILNSTLKAELSEVRDQQGSSELVETLEHEIEKKSRIVIELENDLDTLRRQLEDRDSSSASEGLKEELSQLRDEVKRKERLVVEFEKRNRELQHDLALKEETAAALAEKVAALESASEAGAHEQITALQKELREAQMSAATSSEDAEKIEVLESEVSALRDALKAAASKSEATIASDSNVTELKSFLVKLDRLVDAIDRTDLAPLTTVDRVRLQSAIRDTDPKTTLKKLLDDL